MTSRLLFFKFEFWVFLLVLQALVWCFYNLFSKTAKRARQRPSTRADDRRHRTTSQKLGRLGNGLGSIVGSRSCSRRSASTKPIDVENCTRLGLCPTNCKKQEEATQTPLTVPITVPPTASHYRVIPRLGLHILAQMFLKCWAPHVWNSRLVWYFC